MSMVSAPIDSIEDEFIRSDKDYPYEIVEGQNVEKPRKGAEADRIIVTLIRIIEAQAFGKLGLCFSGHCGYQIFADDPTRVRYSIPRPVRFLFSARARPRSDWARSTPWTEKASSRASPAP